MWSLVALAGLDVLIATTICFFLLNGIGHHLSRIFVFRHANTPYEVSLARYIIVMGISFMLNLIAMFAASQWFGIPYLAASALIAAVFFIGNFVVNRDWTFR